MLNTKCLMIALLIILRVHQWALVMVLAQICLPTPAGPCGPGELGCFSPGSSSLGRTSP